MRTFLKLLLFIIFTNITFAANAQETWEEYVLEARIAHTAGNEEQALKMYKRALQVAPNNQEKVRLHSILAGLYRFTREFQQNIDHLESGVELINKTGEGKEFADDLYMHLCGLVRQGPDPITKDESYCVSYYDNTDKYRSWIKQKNAWTRGFFSRDYTQKATNFTIPNNFPLTLGWTTNQVDPFGEDTNLIFLFLKVRFDKFYIPYEFEEDESGDTAFNSRISVTISYFENLRMETYVEKFIANYQEVEKGSTEAFKAEFSNSGSVREPIQEIYYLKFENKNQDNSDGPFQDEFLIGQKGDLFINLHIRTYRDEFKFFRFVLSLLFDEMNFHLNKQFDSLLEARDRQLPFCLDQEKITYGECVEPKFDSKRGWGMF